MRPLLHLLSIILVLPVVALAGAFFILGRAIATQSVLGILGEVLAVFLWLLPWGLLGLFTVLLALVAGGFSARFRWAAAACVVALALASSVEVLVMVTGHRGFSAGQSGFLVPGLVSVSIGLWLVLAECPVFRRRQIAA